MRILAPLLLKVEAAARAYAAITRLTSAAVRRGVFAATSSRRTLYAVSAGWILDGTENRPENCISSGRSMRSQSGKWLPTTRISIVGFPRLVVNPRGPQGLCARILIPASRLGVPQEDPNANSQSDD